MIMEIKNEGRGGVASSFVDIVFKTVCLGKECSVHGHPGSHAYQKLRRAVYRLTKIDEENYAIIFLIFIYNLGSYATYFESS